MSSGYAVLNTRQSENTPDVNRFQELSHQISWCETDDVFLATWNNMPIWCRYCRKEDHTKFECVPNLKLELSVTVVIRMTTRSFECSPRNCPLNPHKKRNRKSHQLKQPVPLDLSTVNTQVQDSDEDSDDSDYREEYSETMLATSDKEGDDLIDEDEVRLLTEGISLVSDVWNIYHTLQDYTVFSSAGRLSSVTIDKRQTYTSVFFATIMETLHQKCIVINIPCEEKKAWFSAYHELETSSTWKIQFYSKSSAHAEEEPDIDGIVTPEHLRQEVLESKKRRKLTHYYNDAAVVALKSNLSDQVPLWLNGLCVLSAYELFSGGVSSYPFIAENYSMSSDEAHQAVNTIAPIFLESAIILQDDWFMVTSINAFIHYNPSIDDCADFSHIMYQSIANAYIRRKRRFNNKFFKLSIRYGPLEFFATAGFHELCNITETVPFLSISIPDLPTGLVAQVNMPSSTNIYFGSALLVHPLDEAISLGLSKLKELKFIIIPEDWTIIPLLERLVSWLAMSITNTSFNFLGNELLRTSLESENLYRSWDFVNTICFYSKIEAISNVSDYCAGKFKTVTVKDECVNSVYKVMYSTTEAEYNDGLVTFQAATENINNYVDVSRGCTSTQRAESSHHALKKDVSAVLPLKGAFRNVNEFINNFERKYHQLEIEEATRVDILLYEDSQLQKLFKKVSHRALSKAKFLALYALY
ncbi:hypothetical protein CU097_004092, partial [Rhizopus azygosporus]